MNSNIGITRLSPRPGRVTVFMYFETDGDSGYYNIELFSTEEKAVAHREKIHSAYGGVEEIEVQ